MAVESEETDEKNETVVTWLRLQIDKKYNDKNNNNNDNDNNDNNDNNNNNNSNISQNSRDVKSKITTDQVKHENNKFEPSLNIITDTATDTRIITDADIITDMDTDTRITDTDTRMGDEQVYGYRVALMRYCY
jgi:hypothetical protein